MAKSWHFLGSRPFPSSANEPGGYVESDVATAWLESSTVSSAYSISVSLKSDVRTEGRGPYVF